MKKYFLLIFLSSWLPTHFLAQNNDPEVGYAEIGVTQTYLFDNDFVGGHFGLGMEIRPGWLAGLDFGVATRKIREDFDYGLGKPQVQMMDFNLVTQYQLISRRLFHLEGFLMAGVTGVTLFDASVKVEYETEFGTEEKNLEVDKFGRFSIRPGVVAYVTLYDNQFEPQINIFGRVGYRMLIGKDNFAELKDFNGPVFNIGLNVIGFL